MRYPSAETLLRSARRELVELNTAKAAVTRERDEFQARATRAEQEAAEWKRRFDALLLALATEVRDRLASKPGIFGEPIPSELASRVAMAVAYCKEDKHPSPERQSLVREILRILSGRDEL